MTLPYGLGAVQSPPDPRDYPLDQLVEASGIIPTAPPPSFTLPKTPPVYNQGTSPQCVAYANAGEQGAFDLIDQGHNYRWDFGYFFRRIGGTANGAVPRVALDQRRLRGYPLLPAGSGNSQSAHRIKAYYAVPVARYNISLALVNFGAVLISTPWFNSWFDPEPDGTLPSPDYSVGGHEILAIGYSPAGLRLQNSWGLNWGSSGRCTLPWGYLPAVWECWKCVDVIDIPKVNP